MTADHDARRQFAVAVLLAVLVAAAYGRSIGNQFVFDDLIFVRNDPRVRSLAAAPRLFVEPLWGYADEDGRARLHQYYRPLQTLPLALSRAAFGEAAWPCHLLSLLLHLLNALLVLGIVRGVVADDTAALCGAALFAVHPGYSEAVLWISDIAGLAATFCILSILFLHLTGRDRRWPGRLAGALLFLLALWSKESGILAPVLVAAYDLLLAPDRGWRRVRSMLHVYVGFVPPLIVYAVLRLHALGGAVPGLEAVPLTLRELGLNAVALLPQYVATFLWPFHLNMYHEFSAVRDAADWSFLSGAALLAAGVALCAVTFHTHRPIAFGAVWAFLAVSPYLVVRWPQFNVFAERYLYLPAVGIVIGFAYGLQCLRARAGPRVRLLVVTVVSGLLAVFVIADVVRAGDWRDEVTLYERTLTQTSRAPLIRNNLAVTLLGLGRFDEGIAVLEPVVADDPDWSDAWYNLGLLHLAKGDNDRAVAAFDRAWRADPGNRPALLDLGYAYDRAGKREQAVQAYFRLLEGAPQNSKAWYNLAAIALEVGQFQNARTALQHVTTLSPGDAEARRVLQSLLPAESRRAPRPAGRLRTQERCAAAKREFQAGRYGEAVAMLKMAAWLDEAAPLPYQDLANVYFLTGRLRAAIDAQREALARAPDNTLYRHNLEVLENAGHREPGAGAAPLDSRGTPGAANRPQ